MSALPHQFALQQERYNQQDPSVPEIFPKFPDYKIKKINRDEKENRNSDFENYQVSIKKNFC